MLRDRLVVGIRDLALSEKMQTDSALTLESAKKLVRQKEAAREHRKELQEDTPTLNKLYVGKIPYQSGVPMRKGRSHKQQRRTHEDKCRRCGKQRHSPGERCPAIGATCHTCHKKGHFSSQCLTKKTSINEISTDKTTTREDGVFLGTVSSSEPPEDWTVTVYLCRKKIDFKMDTGAEVVAITEETYKQLGEPKLRKPSRILYGATKQPLKVVGVFSERIKKGRNSSKRPIYVVKDLHTNLLSLSAITALKLVRRVNSSSTEPMWTKLYPKLFTGLGVMGESYTIKLKEGAVPYSLHVPRNVPIPQRPQVKTELERMESLGVISKVEHPTEWCAGMVVVPKPSGATRICVDLKPLNNNVLREPHPIPAVDDILAQLTGATHFTKLDANSGFWQIPLAEESRPLTTFITPFGRYQFNKLPFGISSAPELFQCRMNTILDGLDGVVCMMDDVLIFGRDEKQHNEHLQAVFKRLEQANVTLNGAKCKFNKDSVKFLGHVISKDGIQPDPDKTAAIREMETPQNVSEVRRFMGLVNQLGKFSSKIASLSQPIRELLRADTVWTWGPSQMQAFAEIKEELTRPVILRHYDPKALTKVSADASSYGLGAVLLQSEDGKPNTWKPVAYASRSMSDTEKRYAQIEKEALASTWSCEKFNNYIMGRPFILESDHKPLIPLLNSKHLDNLPPRILRFRLRMMKYEYLAEHVPGKYLYVADALSRSPSKQEESNDLQCETEAYLQQVSIPSIPATTEKLKEYAQAQKEDEQCAKARNFCLTEWPNRDRVESPLKPYWKERASLSIVNDLLMYNNRIVIPSKLKKQTLVRIHEGHQGVERCRLRANSSVWWPGVSSDVRQYAESCRQCARESQPRREPLIITPLPDYPWQMIAVDLFEFEACHYLLVVDYFSRYPECVKLTHTTSAHVISILKAIWARHGIPDVVRSDNGPQFSSAEFSAFAKTYTFKHITSSPHYPQSNGQVERSVRTIKGILKKSEDPHLGLLSYRATPMPWCGLSPAELLMGRKIRTTVPQTPTQLTPGWPYLTQFRKNNAEFKNTQKEAYDHRHRVKTQHPIEEGSDIWVTTNGKRQEGTVVDTGHTPRSYIVVTPSGDIRRNRTQLNVIPLPEPEEDVPPDTPEPETEQRPRIVTRSQTGTVIRPPDQLA